MKSDSELEREVKEELRGNPDLDATDIAISAQTNMRPKAQRSVLLVFSQSRSTSRFAYQTSTKGQIPTSRTMPQLRSRTTFRFPMNRSRQS